MKEGRFGEVGSFDGDSVERETFQSSPGRILKRHPSTRVPTCTWSVEVSVGWVEEFEEGREDGGFGWEEGSLSSVEVDVKRVDWDREGRWESAREDDGRPVYVFWDADEGEGLGLGEGEERVQVGSC